MPTVFYYLTDTLSDWECGYLLAELHAGRYLKDPALRYSVVLCGRTMDPVTTMGGIHLQPTELIQNIRPHPEDLLLLPGADTWLDPAQEPVLKKVQEVLESPTCVAAICGATMALAQAGLLDNRPHTSNARDVLTMFCPGYKGEKFYVDRPAVTDKNLVTASGLAPVDFACQVFRRLDVMTPEVLDAWYNLSTTRKPEFFFALMALLQQKAGGA
ncbi:MAG: glutamine amidotransferase [Methanomicrobiales archaeon]|nr:glutamine amidotransferase [Methanomicrobiales archaeon]